MHAEGLERLCQGVLVELGWIAGSDRGTALERYRRSYDLIMRRTGVVERVLRRRDQLVVCGARPFSNRLANPVAAPIIRRS